MEQIALSYRFLRRYSEEAAILDRALTISPKDAARKVQRALVDFYWKADTKPLHQAIGSILAEDSGAISQVADSWLICALAERDHVAAERALVALVDNRWWADAAVILSRSFGEGLLARVMKDEAKARAAFSKARAEQEKIVQAQPDYGPALCVLGLIDAALGRKEAALEEARRATELLPVEKDSVNGSRMLVYFAIGAGWAGEKDLALQQLELGLRAPNPSPVLTYGALKLLPFWDPLRGDPRFEKLVEEAKQPVVGEHLMKIPPDKSIAVLPFENLSRDPDNAFFTDGVQDEILTDLALIADLKVIGRTSVMQYKSRVARNLRKIGQQLGVAHLVEGSVQRSDNRVRVNAQLIDARTERRLWGQTYDRDLSDVFTIQSEIAKAIAEQLHAKLSANEKSEIERPPTSEITAFDLYTRAKDLHLTMSLSGTASVDLLRAADLLNEAVARDPSFFQAHCLLAHTHDLLYYFGVDHTPARLAEAEAAIEAAFRLRPDSGEAHLARAENLYRGYLDYGGALADLEIARQTLPNDPRVFELKGYIERRQGRWEEASRDLEHAIDLDPRDAFMVRRMAWQYLFLRRYADEKSVLERALVIEPNDATTKVWRASVELEWKADTQPLHQIIESIRATNPAALPAISERWLICALAEHDAIGAKDALIAAGENNPPLSDDAVQFSRPFLEGVIARMMKDDTKAWSAFIAARAQQEKIVLAQPNFGPSLCVLGLIDAALGRREIALREARRAIELLPVEKDAISGPLMLEYSAMIAAWVGDKDLACEQLAAAIRFPGPLSYGQLKLLPFWDPLRGDPRFEKIVASLAPKE